MSEMSEHDGEKLVDGQAVFDIQCAGQDDGRNRAEGMVPGRVLARTGSGLKAMVAGERGCGRYASERRRVCMAWTGAECSHFACLWRLF